MTDVTFRPDSTTEGPPGYRERAGETVTVLEEVGPEADPDAETEGVAPLFRIRFEDGTETEAFADELEPSPVEDQ